MAKRSLFDDDDWQGLIAQGPGEREVQVTQAPSETNGIFDKAVMLSLEIGRFGIKRGVASGAVQVDADKTMLHVQKDILRSPEWTAVAKFDNETRKQVGQYALPSQFRAGVYLIALPLVSKLDEYLNQREAERVWLVKRFTAVYEDRRDQALERLGVLGSVRDYPSVESVERKFFMSHRWIEASVPGRLSVVSRALFLREQEKSEKAWSEARELGIEVMRAQFQGLVDHMVDRLRPGDDGKPKIFKKSLVENLDQFMGDLFTAKNTVYGDQELAALIDRGRDLLRGVESKDLKNTSLREAVAAGFGEIKLKLDRMVGERPGRKLSIAADDDDDW